MQNTSNFARPIDGGMVLRNRVVVVELNISGTIVACPFTLSLQNSEASYSVVMPTSLAWSCTEPKKSSCSITVASQKRTPGTHISGFVRHGLFCSFCPVLGLFFMSWMDLYLQYLQMCWCAYFCRDEKRMNCATQLTGFIQVLVLLPWAGDFLFHLIILPLVGWILKKKKEISWFNSTENNAPSVFF